MTKVIKFNPMNLLTQTNYATLVNVPKPRISLLIKQNRLMTQTIDGVIFVIDNEENRLACNTKLKRGPKKTGANP